MTSPPGDTRPPERADGRAYRARLQRDVVSGSLWTVLAAVLTLPVTFAANLVVVHALGAQRYGHLALSVSVYAIVVIVLNSGVSDATVQWLAAAHARGDRAAETDLVRRCVAYHVMVEAPAVAVVTAVLLRGAPLPVLVGGVAAAVVTQVLGTSSVVLTATARNATAARISLVVTLGTQAALAGAATTSHVAPTVFAAQLVAALAAPTLAWLAVDTPTRRALLRPGPLFGWPEGFRRYAWGVGAGSVVTAAVFGRSELFVLSAFHDAAAVGLFAVAAALAAQLTVPIDSVMGPLLPAAAALVETAPHLATDAVLRGVRVSATLAALTAAVAVAPAAAVVDLVYGDAFEGARGAVLVLGVVSCLQSTAHPVLVFALATRGAGQVLRVNLVCLTVDAAVAVATVPFLGLAGAVAASALAQVLSVVLVARVAARRLGLPAGALVRAGRAVLLAPALTALATAAAVPLHGSWWAAAASATVGAGSVLVLLAAVPSLRLSRADADAIIGASPRRLLPVFTLVFTRAPLTVPPPVPERLDEVTL
ncbi:lipopolysaccharide biosynthesis protein [Jatrophihabitans sp. YIM 134969]